MSKKQLYIDKIKEIIKEHYIYPEYGVITYKNGKIAGYINKYGYLILRYKRRNYCFHHIFFYHYHGYLPIVVDHHNQYRLDNRISNLKPSNFKKNARNRTISKRNKSGHSGVYYSRRKNRYIATIGVNGKSKYLGSFKLLKDAVAVRQTAEIKYDYSVNHGRHREKIVYDCTSDNFKRVQYVEELSIHFVFLEVKYTKRYKYRGKQKVKNIQYVKFLGLATSMNIAGKLIDREKKY